MNRSFGTFLLIILSFVPFWYFFNQFQSRKPLPVLPPQSLPAPALKIVSGGHNEVAAQNLYFKTMFYNELRAEEGNHQIDHETTVNLLDITNQLDPYNADCYYYGQALLAEQPDFVRPLNTILLRSMKNRSWDHYPPWFLGSNYYYTLQDKKMAGIYFSEAAKRRPDIAFFATFAARSLHEGAETEMAVKVLREMLHDAKSPLVAEPIKNRLLAFETVLFLRQALERYSKQFKKPAQRLEDLVNDHILKDIPPDPYGGHFYLDKDGAVQTTSNYAMKQK
ncbi:MAG: hypothetical protein K9L30_13365 [Desulfobacterales bacterium]|nr:hypothetical protein [Desulfobacterales bacterium]